MPPSTAFSAGTGRPPCDEHDQQIAAMQRTLRRLHAELAGHSPGSTDHRNALGAVLAATRDLLTYEAGVPAARAAQRRRDLRPRILAIAGGLAAAGVVMLVLAVTGVTGTAAAVAAVGAELTAGLIGAGTSDRLAGQDALSRRQAAVAAATAAGAMIGAAFWWPATVALLPAIGIGAHPWMPETATLAAGGVDSD